MNAAASYSVRRVEEMTGLPRTTISALVAAECVSPVRGERNELQFSFQDLVLLKTAQSLRLSRFPTRKILRALKAVRADLPASMPLTGLCVIAVGNRIAVREGLKRWDAESGQLLLAFDVEPGTGDMVTASMSQTQQVDPQHVRALESFDLAVSLEAANAAAAETAYRRAIELQPCFEDAYVNLGALLCEAGRCDDAVQLFQMALRHCGEAGLVLFNLGIALEDQGKTVEAIAAYQTALAADADLADAHFNIAVLLERDGDFHGALRHFNAYRRLMKADGVCVPLGGL